MLWNLKKYENNIAAVDDRGTSLTYGKLEKEQQELAQAVGERCLVFILCSNTIGCFLGYSAFLNYSVVPLMIAGDLRDEYVENLMEAYRPKYIWCPQGAYGGEAAYSAYGYELIRTQFAADYPMNEELALLLTTSGSTGSPKFVRQSYKNILSNAASIAEYLEIDETERAITTLPMNYTYGLSIINSHLLVGARICFTDTGIMQKPFWDFIKESEATSFGGVPYTYEMLAKLRFTRMKLPELRYMTQAGGKLSPQLHKMFAEYAAENDKKFIVMYGQCEATARMGYLPAEKSIEKYGSMGIAIPGGVLELQDEAGRVIKKTGEVGELVYRGDNVTLGYAGSWKDLNLGDERGGVLHTGDMAKADEDGYFYIVGRRKRFLKIFGNRVNLDEIDGMIRGEYGNIQCASAGEDDHLTIFLTDTGIDSGELTSFLAKKTGLNHSAFSVRVIDEIPRNNSGKILYQTLAEYLEKENEL